MLKHKLILGSFLTIVLTAFSLFLTTVEVSAATLTVETTADDTVSDGNCTLREAINNINAQADAHPDCTFVGAYGTDDTIEFAITGTADFTNGGQNGYTISPTSPLPTITETVVINGYTQDGADPNSTIAPQPMDGVLLIQIDGTSAGVSENGLNFDGGASGSAGSSVSGLIIINFTEHGIYIGANDITVRGNYIGTDYTGLSTTDGNGNAGITHEALGVNTDNALIGGTSPADRNIISGNGESGGYPKDGWIIQGNYVGIGRDGETAVPNSGPGGSGAFSIDECDGVILGGTVQGAANVISGNASHGVAPLDAINLTIQGNLIGTDWTGTQAVPNVNGVTFGGNLAGSVLGGTTEAARNIISGNTEAGILSGSTGGLRIEGNFIGLNSDGQATLSNGTFGVAMGGVGETLGGSVAARNVISGNTQHNVGLYAFPPFLGSTVSGNVISSNYIGTDADGNIDPAITAVQGAGVVYSASVEDSIIGGTAASDSNLIAGNRGYGVGVRTYVAGVLTSWSPANIAILGNAIYGNTAGGFISGGDGVGIDHYEAVDDEPNFTVDSMTGLGSTPNDASDVDTGPNNYMNFPVLSSATQNGTSLTVDLDLDAADTTDPSGNYRVEFFANDAVDQSGFGEGQTYLGYTDISNGNNKTATITLQNGTDLTGKVLSATTTAIDGTTTSGFGATSEFSQSASVTVVNPTPENQDAASGGVLAKTGANLVALTTIVGGLMVSGGALLARRRF